MNDRKSGLKDFFSAGLEMESARDAKEAAREVLRVAAAERCPMELGAFDKAGAALDEAEKKFAAAMEGVAREQYDAAHTMLHSRGIDCGDAKCPLKRAPSTSGGMN